MTMMKRMRIGFGDEHNFVILSSTTPVTIELTNVSHNVNCLMGELNHFMIAGLPVFKLEPHKLKEHHVVDLRMHGIPRENKSEALSIVRSSLFDGRHINTIQFFDETGTDTMYTINQFPK